MFQVYGILPFIKNIHMYDGKYLYFLFKYNLTQMMSRIDSRRENKEETKGFYVVTGCNMYNICN